MPRTVHFPRTIFSSASLFAMVLLFLAEPAVRAQDVLSDTEQAAIDSSVQRALRVSGAPGVSIAVVRDGAIVYERAYGRGRIDPEVPASSGMRYCIGSVTKQFVATAVLLLAEEGKLSLDDKVARWFPALERAGDITLRRLLSMTSGYQDYWPQDYVMPGMLTAATPQSVTAEYAGKRLDFDPGMQWQYSNTNYLIAGMIVEQVSGRPLFDLLRERIFTPLGMTSVVNIDGAALGAEDAQGCLRNAFGPLRPAPKEAQGWLFAAGNLAMTAHDLALWDLSIIRQSILKPASYRAMQTAMPLENGLPTEYGLGIGVEAFRGHRKLGHSGGVSGFQTMNIIYPDERAAVVVFVNSYPGCGFPSNGIASRIENLLFSQTDGEADQALELAKRVFADLQKGAIDRALFSDNANAYFSDETLADYAASLAPLGAPTTFVQQGRSTRGGMTLRGYYVRGKSTGMSVSLFLLPDGKIEQYIVGSAE
jgi:D-alanyl-D-alanine carboxypeptidase